MRTILVATMLAGAAMTAPAADTSKVETSKALEEAFSAALASKRGVTLYVNGQTIGGAITKVESGKYIELRSQEFSKIVIRWDSIDGIAMP